MNMPLIKPSEAAKRLGISKRTLYNWISSKRLQASVIRTPTGRILLDWEALLDELRQWHEFWEEKRRRPRAAGAIDGVELTGWS
jgi:excisionase family DNA binding protein